MAARRRQAFSDQPPLIRRRLLRARRRQRRRRAGAVSAVVLAAVVAGMLLTRHPDRESDASGSQSVRMNADVVRQTSTTVKRAASPDERSTTTSTRPTPVPPAVAPAAPQTSPPSSAVPTTTQPEPPTTVDPQPVDGEVDPQSPPVTGRAGPQGPVRDGACPPTGQPKVTPAVVDDPSDEGQWVTVARIAGNCGARSAPVTTTGADSRLVYRSDASEFQVFLVDLSDPDTSGGFADVECRTSCSNVQDLTDPAGRYQLKVAATNAPWELLLQEYR